MKISLLCGWGEYSGVQSIFPPARQLSLWSVRSREPVRALPNQLPHLVDKHRLVSVLIVNDLRPSSRAVANLTCPDIWCAVLVTLSQNLSVINERLLAGQYPGHPGEAGLEQPHKLIQVVERDVEGL